MGLQNFSIPLRSRISLAHNKATSARLHFGRRFDEINAGSTLGSIGDLLNRTPHRRNHGRSAHIEMVFRFFMARYGGGNFAHFEIYVSLGSKTTFAVICQRNESTGIDFHLRAVAKLQNSARLKPRLDFGSGRHKHTRLRLLPSTVFENLHLAGDKNKFPCRLGKSRSKSNQKNHQLFHGILLIYSSGRFIRLCLVALVDLVQYANELQTAQGTVRSMGTAPKTSIL